MRLNSLNQLNAAIDITSDKKIVKVNKVWEKLVDWESQSDWMMATKVWSTKIDDTNGIGIRISAFSGLAPKKYKKNNIWSKLGVLDTMEVTKWEPPLYCKVIHDGKIIKGSGEFRLEAIENGVRFYWEEVINAPWPLMLIVKPGILISVKISLRRFRKILLEN